MILKPCPFCQKDIPRSITVCPYCHRDEQGKSVAMDSSVAATSDSGRLVESDLRELASDDPFVRDQAVMRVAQRGPGIVPMLMNVLSDFSKPGLAGVAKALGKIGDKRAIPVLAQAAKMGDDDLRCSAVWALTQFHDPEVLPVLLSEAERPHAVIQSFLAHILGTFQEGRVIPVLAKLAGNSNREVAFQAAFALGDVGDREAIPALKKTWRNRDPLIRAASAASLRRLGGKPSWISPLTLIVWLSVLAIAGVALAWFFYK